MSGRTEILDQPEHLTGPFVGSLLLHFGLVGIFIAAATVHIFGGNVEHWGDPNGGRFGAVTVNAVPSIQLPNRSAVPNPVANDTESQVPQAPPKPKVKPQPKPKLRAPDPDAIPLKMRNAKRAPAASQPNKWQEKQSYRENQLYSSSGQAVSSPMYQMRGGGGVGIGSDSPLGTQFGAYANLLLNLVGQHWHPSALDSRGQNSPAVVQFTLLRNGSVVPGSVRIVQTSGSRAIDYSSQRAILDVDQFPPLPVQFTRDRVDLQLHFDLRH